MKFLFLFLLSLCASVLPAQTIIELKPGGGVRGKTVEDYRDEQRMAEVARKDSLAYVDHLRRAFNALSTDSLDEAERRFRLALKLRPEAPGNHVVHYNLALIELARGKCADAIAQLNPLIKDYPLYYDARLARAEAELRSGLLREGEEDAGVLLNRETALGVADDVYRRARFVRAAARYRLRLYTEARTDLQLLLQQEPDNENARLLETLILQKTGQTNEALNRLNLIVAANPQSIDALTTRAGLEAELQMYARAKADYDALIALCPQESEFYLQRAKMLINLSEKTAARRDLDTAVKLGVPHGTVQPLYNLTR